MKHPLPFLCAGALSAAAIAQPDPVPRVIGYATDTNAAIAAAILSQAACTPADRVCPSGVGPVAARHAGGAAYNAINASLWHTQGTRMAEVRIADCRLLCSAPANLVLGAGSVVTGLEVTEADYRLYQLESIPGAAALSVRHIRSCPPNVVSACRVTLPTAAHVAGAVAVDPREGLVYYATSVFGAAAPANVVLVARVDDPCNILCRFPADACGSTRLGAITGMGFDSCRRMLVVTDGRQTLFLARENTANPCIFRPVRCCAPSPGIGSFTWHGIDVEPVHPRQVGRACAGGSCTQCGPPSLGVHGDPVIGNGAFAATVDNVLAGSQLLIGVSAGPCQVPGLPLFCGRWHTNLTITAWVGPFAANGSGCNASATVPLHLPTDYGLCGAAICMQAAVVCPGTLLGLALTNAVELVLGG